MLKIEGAVSNGPGVSRWPAVSLRILKIAARFNAQILALRWRCYTPIADIVIAHVVKFASKVVQIVKKEWGNIKDRKESLRELETDTQGTPGMILPDDDLNKLSFEAPFDRVITIPNPEGGDSSLLLLLCSRRPNRSPFGPWRYVAGRRWIQASLPGSQSWIVDFCRSKVWCDRTVDPTFRNLDCYDALDKETRP